jgi:hypothetical protein
MRPGSGVVAVTKATSAWTYPLLALAVLAHVVLCWYLRTDLAFDPKTIYLPFAQRLLDEGWTFLASERSVWYPFGAYGYPALLGANLHVVEAVNLVLSSAVVLMLYRTGALAHSVRGGLVAAWLYAASPAVAPLVINALTEPPYFFLCAVWLWAFGELCASGARRWVWIGGLALGCAVNLRASLVLYIVGSALLAVVASRYSGTGRDTWKKFAGVQLVAALIAIVVIAKNWLLFDLLQISTGGGNAFYLGNHPLTGGYDPDVVGLFFDVNGVAQELQLTVQADRRLFAVGWDMLRTQPLEVTLANYLRKTWAFLFYPNVSVSDSLFTLRSWRIALLAGAAVGVLRGWRSPIVLLAASVVGYQVLAHAPLLFTPRYSVGALDLWLALLAGCGFATASRWSLRNVSLLALAIVIAIYAGKTIRLREGAVAPLHFNAAVPHRVLWEQRGVPPGALTGFVADAATNALTATASVPSMRIALPEVEGIAGNARIWQRSLFLILGVTTLPGGKRCTDGLLRFHPSPANPDPLAPVAYYPFSLAGEAASRTFAFGIATRTPTWPAGIDGPGDFEISFACEAGGGVRLDRLAIAESTYAEAYGRKSAAAPGASVVPVVEYYNPALDRYFVTWVADEMATLDADVDVTGWQRTGYSFRTYATAQPGALPICRFSIPPGLGNSHILGLGTAECNAIAQANPGYVLESSNFTARMVPPQGGGCPAGTVPVYRLRNDRGIASYRYTTDKSVRDRVAASGGLPEREGADHVAMCAPQ